MISVLVLSACITLRNFLFGSVCADESLEVLVPLMFLGLGFGVFGFFGIFGIFGRLKNQPLTVNGLIKI